MKKLLILIIGIILCILFPPLILLVLFGVVIYTWASGIGQISISKADKKKKEIKEKQEEEKKLKYWQCPKCGKTNDCTSDCCLKCGFNTKLFWSCPKCNTSNNGDTNFCQNCGYKYCAWDKVLNYFESNNKSEFLYGEKEASLLYIDVNEDKLIFEIVDAHGNKLWCEISNESRIATAFYGSDIIGDITLKGTIDFYDTRICWEYDDNVKRAVGNSGKSLGEYLRIKNELNTSFEMLYDFLKDSLKKSGLGITLKDLGMSHLGL